MKLDEMKLDEMKLDEIKRMKRNKEMRQRSEIRCKNAAREGVLR